MAYRDLTLPLIPEAAQQNRGPVPLTAYVPLTVALIGVAFILVGGLSTRNAVHAAVTAPPAIGIDAVVTGSIDRTAG